MPSLGVVIPAVNEAANLPGILADLRLLESRCDLVVVDGGSDDDTVGVARRAGARVITAPRGRASQLNAGARAVVGEWLCFVHADVRMPAASRRVLLETLSDGTAAAVWRFAIDAPGMWFRVVEFGALLRDLLGGLPYGDQGLVVRREVYEAVGGFPSIPLMEDVAMVRAVRRHVPIRRLPAPLRVSARRWNREGPYRTWVRNIALVSAFLAGVPPERLVRWYRPEPK